MEQRQEGIVAEYAGFWMRLGAYLIDGIALWIICVILGSMLGIVAFPFVFWAWAPMADHMMAYQPLWVLLGRIIGFCIWMAMPAAYFICFWAVRGETLGMMALRIRVIHTDGSPVDWGAAVVRFLGYIICWITLGLLFLWIAFDGRKQGLHDKMGDTYVIKLPPRRAKLTETQQRD